MLTLYAPAAGTVLDLPGEPGLAMEVRGASAVAAPTRGTLDLVDAGGFELTDLQGRRVGVRLTADADAGALVPLLAKGDQVGFDQPVFRWEPSGDGVLHVTVVSLGNADVMPHVTPGDELAPGADLFSVGPFACGA